MRLVSVRPAYPLRRPTGHGPRRIPGQMNKTEERYSRVLEGRRLAGEIYQWWFERLTLKLADDTRYTPDFLVQLADGSLELHEVKGFMREDAFIKLKVSASAFPFRFFLVTALPLREGGAFTLKPIGDGETDPFAGG